MLAKNYISRFRKRFGEQIMCSANYKLAKRELHDAIFLSEKYYNKDFKKTSYLENYPTEIKRLSTDIPYKDAQAITKTNSTHQFLWSLPISSINHIVFSNDDQLEFDVQMHICVADCVIWTHIIHSNNTTDMSSSKPSENLLYWLFFKYVDLFYKRDDGSDDWNTHMTYNTILDSLIRIVGKYAWKPNDFFQDAIRREYEGKVIQRNLFNYRYRYKKKDGDVYILKSEDNFNNHKYSNSATCKAKYNAEQMSIISDLSMSRNEAAKQLKELGYSVSPRTVSNIRQRLADEKNKELEEREKKQHVGPLDF